MKNLPKILSIVALCAITYFYLLPTNAAIIYCPQSIVCNNDDCNVPSPWEISNASPQKSKNTFVFTNATIDNSDSANQGECFYLSLDHSASLMIHNIAQPVNFTTTYSKATFWKYTNDAQLKGGLFFCAPDYPSTFDCPFITP